MPQAVTKEILARERAAVRGLAGEVAAARIALAKALGGPRATLDQRVDRVLIDLWRRRFAGELSDPTGQVREVFPGRRANLEPVVDLLDRPVDASLAERLAQAHEITLTHSLSRRGRKVVLQPSGTRRSKGVYYTPPDVVRFIVEHTLGAILAPWESRLPRASRRECSKMVDRARALTVLDPACGGGAFLLGALERLRAFYRRVRARLVQLRALIPTALDAKDLALGSLYGVDLDERALGLAALALQASAGARGATLVAADHLELAHRDLFPAVFSGKDPGFDVVLGNPPYARMTGEQKARARQAGFAAAACEDIYALFVEGLCRLTSRSGRGGLIVPLSVMFSRATRALRDEVVSTSKRRWRFASFDRIPSGLFESEVRTRTTILTMEPEHGQDATVEAARLLRFTAADRPRVFEGLEHFCVTHLAHADLGWPKPGSALQTRWLEGLLASGQRLGDGFSRSGPHRLHYKQNCYGFAIVTAELPPSFDAADQPVPQTKYSSVGFPSATARDAALALTAGRWLFWWWLVYGDGFDMTGQLMGALPIDPRSFPAPTRRSLARLGRRIQTQVRDHVAYKKNGGKRIGTFDLRACRDLTDRADDLVAAALGAEDLLTDLRAFLARTHGAG